MTHCRYHCGSCGAHFTSLEAFDAHGPRNRSEGCEWPEDVALIEMSGKCSIADEQIRYDVTIYSTARASRARDHFGAQNAREAAPARRKTGAYAR